MLHELNSLGLKGDGVFTRPYFVLGDFQNGAPVLEDEVQRGIEETKLDEESAWFGKYPVSTGGRRGGWGE